MDQIIENQLNLALNLKEGIRERTTDLNTGYNPAQNEWELIVRYNGDIRNIADAYGARVKVLSAGYAVVTIAQEYITDFSRRPQIIYIEKPKKLTFEEQCVPSDDLTGQGVIVAVIDSGIDYMHPEFILPDGTSKILAIYDEYTDTVYDRQEINRAIEQKNTGSIPGDFAGHGTAVASIAAGRYIGIAPEADIVCVRLARDNFFNTARLMEGIDFVLTYGADISRPVAVNISIGNNYGAHNDSSLLETYINEVSGAYRSVICVGSGNEADRNVHIEGNAADGGRYGLAIGEYEQSIDIQIWKNYSDDFDVEISAPNFSSIVIGTDRRGFIRYAIGNTAIYVYVGEAVPYSVNQEIFVQMVAENGYILSGVWQITIIPRKIRLGMFDMWLPAGGGVSTDTGFTTNYPDTTITIPATAYKAISVGAYDQRRMIYAPFSGRGFTKLPVGVKPDLVAPGVDVRAAASGGGYRYVTGTSFATPNVTGAAALFMEWGIVRGNDLYMYGEKIKAELIRRAVRLPGEEVYPNERLGYGTLCFPFR